MDDVFDLHPRGDIQTRERLIEKQDVGVVKKGSRKQDFLPHPFRIGRDRGQHIIVEVEKGQEGLDFFFERPFRKMPQPPTIRRYS
jgi:hypothetical protein